MDRFHTVNRLWWSLFLAASLLLNIGFAVNYMRTASQLNIAWYDTTGQFSHAAFLAGSSAGEVWVALVTDLQPGFLAERLAANRPLFLKGIWRKIWDEAVDPAFAEAKLIPLPR